MKKILLVLYTGYCTAVFLLFTFFSLFVYLFAIIFFPHRPIEILYHYIHFWGKAFLFCAGLKLEIKGEEHIKPDTAYVIVSNHTSPADMFPMAAGVKIPFRPLGKIELKKIPVLGFIFSLTLVFVDRSNAESRRQSMIDMRKVLDKGISVVIFPEGTRNRTQMPMKDFFDGAFRLAVETETPILPMVYCNALHMWSNDTFLIHPVDLKAIYLPPVETKGLTEADIPELKNKIRAMMEPVILSEDMRFAKN
jgi:1-acyl-sn-glycerol-3-phosphate acyltransferase